MIIGILCYKTEANKTFIGKLQRNGNGNVAKQKVYEQCSGCGGALNFLVHFSLVLCETTSLLGLTKMEHRVGNEQ